MDTRIYEGFLVNGSNGEEHDLLALATEPGHWQETLLVEQLREDIGGRQVTVRYYIADRKITQEEGDAYLIEQLYGEIEADYCMCYSEITGYLWTDEDLNVGGHDLLTELKGYVGKYLLMIVDVHE